MFTYGNVLACENSKDFQVYCAEFTLQCMYDVKLGLYFVSVGLAKVKLSILFNHIKLTSF